NRVVKLTSVTPPGGWAMIVGLPTSFLMRSLAASTTALLGMVLPAYLHTPVLVACQELPGWALSLRKATIRVPRIGVPSGPRRSGQSTALEQAMPAPGRGGLAAR